MVKGRPFAGDALKIKKRGVPESGVGCYAEF